MSMRIAKNRLEFVATGFIPGTLFSLRAGLLAGAMLASVVVPAATMMRAQAAPAPAAASARKSGTVKSADDHSLVLTTAAGDVTVNVMDSTKILIVPPGSTNLSSATPGTMGDIQSGDKALVNGSSADTATSVAAVRVVVMKSGAIAQVHAQQASAWAQGTGGIVKSVNGGSVVVSSGMKTLTVETEPGTIVRRYSGASIKFEDAVTSSVGAIQPGDQLRVRGTKSPDGATVTADEIVTGSFRNYSGTIASIDGTAGTITLKDLTTKKSVTVAVTPNSDVRRLDAMRANMIAMRMKGGVPGAPAAAGPSGPAAGGGGAPAGAARPAGGAGGYGGGRPGGYPGGGQGGQSGFGGSGRAGSDLSSMLSRLPTETLGGLKAGEAVMIVASAPTGDTGKGTAITLLVGVDPILEAPAGASTTLSPWSMGGGGGGEGEGGGGL